MEASEHAKNSVLRERIVEHLLIGEILRRLWAAGRTRVEVLRAEFDRGGYDLVIDLDGVSRHIQLKCSRTGAATAVVPVSLSLSARQAGCVIWMIVDDELRFDHFLWLGGAPLEQMPDVSGHAVVLATRFDSKGNRPARENLRNVPRSRFTRLETIDELLDRLFDVGWRGTTSAGLA